MGILGDATEEERNFIKRLRRYEHVDDVELGADHSTAIAEMKARQDEKRSAVIANCEELKAIEAEQHEG